MRQGGPLRLSLRIVFYREDESWVAHCLETDLVGVGETKREAMATLWDATTLQFEASREWDNPANFFSPAEGRYFEMYARGRDVATAEMDVSAETLKRIDGDVGEILGREYVDRDELAVV
ncbi:hypothetical protein [Paludisphaera rhizosphaerae]|uniref:hypothetical protein n=1 Tax=Paludisphaera rhizosphaerae TaxID=2711216 RepID=UPI0013EA2E4C|nr:hypothetical protein [Paludisphaera rhizosphaerae]